MLRAPRLGKSLCCAPCVQQGACTGRHRRQPGLAGVFPPGPCRVLGRVGLYWVALVVLGAPFLQQMRKGSSKDEPCTPRATSPGPQRPPGHQTQVGGGAWSPFSSHSISSKGPRSQQFPTTPFPCLQHHIGALKALEILRITAPAGGFFQVRTPS